MLSIKVTELIKGRMYIHHFTISIRVFFLYQHGICLVQAVLIPRIEELVEGPSHVLFVLRQRIILNVEFRGQYRHVLKCQVQAQIVTDRLLTDFLFLRNTVNHPRPFLLVGHKGQHTCNHGKTLMNKPQLFRRQDLHLRNNNIRFSPKVFFGAGFQAQNRGEIGPFWHRPFDTINKKDSIIPNIYNPKNGIITPQQHILRHIFTSQHQTPHSFPEHPAGHAETCSVSAC